MPNKGFKHSDESKKKIGERRGWKHSEETKQKIGNANRGRILSEEQKKRMSEISHKYWSTIGKEGRIEHGKKSKKCMIGNQHMLGRIMSEETKKKMSESAKRVWNNLSEEEKAVKRLQYCMAARSGKKVTRPQMILYDIVKQLYPEAVLEYRIETNQSWRFADIALVEQKVDVEYDGSYWHRNPESDEIRNKHLEEIGWKTVRVDDSMLNRLHHNPKMIVGLCEMGIGTEGKLGSN